MPTPVLIRLATELGDLTPEELAVVLPEAARRIARAPHWQGGRSDPVTELAQLRARVAELEASRARLAASVRAADNVKVCVENLGGDANTADLLVFYCLAKEANDQYDAARAALTEADLA